MRLSASPNAHIQLRNLTAFTLAFFTVWSLRATVLYPIDETIQSTSPAWREIYAAVVRLVIFVVPVFVCLAIVDKVDALQFLHLNTPIDWKGLLYGSAFVIVFFALGTLIQYALAGTQKQIAIDIQARSWYAIVLGLPIAPIAEEILFRGFVLRKSQELLSFWLANLVTSLLFVAIHWPYWLYSQGFGMDRIMLSISIFIVGMLSGYLVQRTNSLWPSIVMHLLNNFVSGTLIIG